jgi:hypothetical protein
LASSARREKRGKAAGRGEICGGAGSAGRRGEEEEKEGGRERLTGGVAVSARAKKRKRERDGPARGELGGLAGLAGPKGERVRFSLFFFFFKLLFKTAFLFKFKLKLFQTFSQKFINLLETTQATKNHASQLMMHNHLLSLSLLNYV